MDKHAAPARSTGRSALAILWKAAKIAFLLVLLAFLGLNLLFLPSLFRCVLEGTLIDTPRGPVPVERLSVGDAVWTQAPDGGVGRGFVIAVHRGRALRYRHLVFEDGRDLRVTGTHPIATAPGVFVAAGTLKAGAEVESRVGRLELVSVASGYGLADVYDLSVEPGASFFANGVLVHNKSPHAYESATIGDLRNLVSAQSAYQSVNNGYCDARLECLAAPWACIPGYPPDGPSVLDDAKVYLENRNRYAREFIPGKPVETLLEGVSPSSVQSFAYLAIPLVAKEGTRRAFCGDDTGRICFTPNGERPLVEGRPVRCWMQGDPVNA